MKKRSQVLIRLEKASSLLTFIQVTNPFIIYSHLLFRHVEPCSMAGHMSHISNLVYDLVHHESPIAQWLERPTVIWKVMGSE